MIKVIVAVKKDGGYKSIEFSGHALFAEYGKDILCAAVSVLALNTLNSIEALCEDKFISYENPEEGYLKAEFEEDLSSEANLLMKSLILGLDGLSEEYGKKFIRIIRQEV